MKTFFNGRLLSKRRVQQIKKSLEGGNKTHPIVDSSENECTVSTIVQQPYGNNYDSNDISSNDSAASSASVPGSTFHCQITPAFSIDHTNEFDASTSVEFSLGNNANSTHMSINVSTSNNDSIDSEIDEFNQNESNRPKKKRTRNC